MSDRQVIESSLVLEKLEFCDPGTGSERTGQREELVKDGHRQSRLNGCVPLSHQVAGHKYGIDKMGILQHPDGTVLKQLQPPPRGPREMNFYTQVYAEDCTDPKLLELRQHLPKFYGTWVSRESPDDLYLKLEDVTRSFHQPCIMDVKIGRKSYDPFASQEKREQQIKKYPLMEEIGFLLLGMRVYQVNSGSYITHDQFYGRSLKKDTLKEGLAKFFHNGEQLRKDAVSLSISKVRNILRWFEGQKQLHFYASSLLFVYEGSPQTGNGTAERETPKDRQNKKGEPEFNNNFHTPVCKPQDLSCRCTPQKSVCGRGLCDDFSPDIQENGTGAHFARHYHLDQPNGNELNVTEEREKKENNGKNLDTSFEDGDRDRERGGGGEVRMIDFAHVFPSDSPDEGYTYGLRNLLSALEQILQN
ncbi:inositol polyphosphate multikinase [Chanos chanos]|uniref:Kinase n=1 Tax=Chanos chanos TaxID=29144 RepID=A0A6J2V8T6_CHACN|nr:inositol polyphosphate multikinase-like [Chanos chanos]